jgi:hypothetical protein
MPRFRKRRGSGLPGEWIAYGYVDLSLTQETTLAFDPRPAPGNNPRTGNLSIPVSVSG